MPRCPVHNIDLRQCGEVSTLNHDVPIGTWLPMNLWHCIDCKHPNGVFQLIGSKVTKVNVQ